MIVPLIFFITVFSNCASSSLEKENIKQLLLKQFSYENVQLYYESENDTLVLSSNTLEKNLDQFSQNDIQIPSTLVENFHTLPLCFLNISAKKRIINIVEKTIDFNSENIHFLPSSSVESITIHHVLNHDDVAIKYIVDIIGTKYKTREQVSGDLNTIKQYLKQRQNEHDTLFFLFIRKSIYSSETILTDVCTL